MNIDEQLSLLMASVDAVERIKLNGGRVPFDEILEWRGRDGKWNVCDRLGSAPDFAPLRLRDETPRFTVSENPLGILDRDRPGMIAKFRGDKSFVEDIIKNDQANLIDDYYDWEPLEVPLGPEDIPPLSIVRMKGDPSWNWYYAKATPERVLLMGGVSVDYDVLFESWEIRRNGEDWKPCRKAAK